MKDREWSRSRFWLCHFLHNRHERRRMDWSPPARIEPRLRPLVAHWLAHSASLPAPVGAWMIDAAARQCANDPAYVQSLRLMVKEEQYLTGLSAKLLARLEPQRALHEGLGRLARPLRHFLGLRLELSVVLLQEVVDLTFCGMIHEATEDDVLRAACRQIVADRSAHASFLAERLTLEFADFNFVRRNVRRLRLRLLFGALLATQAMRYHALIRAAGWTPQRFVRLSWVAFTDLLERMVPYHRDALMAALLTQRERPYDKPLRVS
jgi:hypothetical protein